MANLAGNSLFTSALTGLNSNYLLLLNGAQGLSMDKILNPDSDTIKYTVNQSFRSYLLNNFNYIDMDGDGEISTADFSNYTTKLRTQGMTFQELSQLCTNSGGTSMSSLLDTVLSNFNEIDQNHDGRVTQGEINAYRITQEIKEVKDEYPKVDPTKMSIFYESSAAQTQQSSKSNSDKVFN